MRSRVIGFVGIAAIVVATLAACAPIETASSSPQAPSVEEPSMAATMGVPSTPVLESSVPSAGASGSTTL